MTCSGVRRVMCIPLQVLVVLRDCARLSRKEGILLPVGGLVTAPPSCPVVTVNLPNLTATAFFESLDVGRPTDGSASLSTDDAILQVRVVSSFRLHVQHCLVAAPSLKLLCGNCGDIKLAAVSGMLKRQSAEASALNTNSGNADMDAAAAAAQAAQAAEAVAVATSLFRFA